ncbi:hypothetical protein [Clostridium perfringens]|uniref:hypothetical protein n=1 Tax=Clostridium perfringens TaxID=1502 RepID=UPI00016BD79A|nr:hypothetical protein [Clostridium perfringens]EDT25464.1 hypothetical protein AC5_A0220 [Clostridium perfringens CPE str. F4969]
MLHTLTIKHKIISPKDFNAIYKSLEKITGEKPRKVNEGNYITRALKSIGFTNIQLTSKKINSKYKYNFMQIKIILNPVKLLRRNKLEVIEEDHVEKLRKVFAEEIKKIHVSLPILDYWTVNRIDYAININTPYVKEYIKLFQRADKPKGFKELYCSKSKTRKQLEGSFYLFNDSVAINFYDKESERAKQGFNADEAKNILRLEIQCKQLKINTLKVKNGFSDKCLKNYLSKNISFKQIEHYYNNTIGAGDYYKLSEAILIIKDSNYTSKTKKKLIEVLKAVNKHKSIWRAREKSKFSTSNFNRYLEKIRNLTINPVTIPVRWKINNLINLMNEVLKYN